MGAPRQTISPNTNSVGFSTRLVTITAITPDGTTAICVDKTGTEVRVPMLFQRAKGALPAVGEQWLVAQDITSSYSFAAILTKTSTPFTSPIVSNGSTGGGGPNNNVGTVLPGTIIAPQSIDALKLSTLAFGTNIITDPQYSNALINADRLADPGTQGTWNITLGSNAIASGTHLATLAMMPSNLVPLYVNPGEQYYLSVQANLSAGSGVTAGIQFVFNTGAVLGPDVPLSAGPNTVAQMITIPAGVVSAYVRLITSGQTGSQTITFTSPTCYISAGPNQLQPNSVTANAIAAAAVTANSIAANAVTANAIAANAVTAAAISAGSVTAAAIAAGTIVAGIVNGTTITGAHFVAYGSTGEILIYSGTPATGNLIMSFSASAGSDSFGNAYPAGFTVGLSSTTQVQMVSNGGVGNFNILFNNASFTSGQMFGSVISNFADLVINGPATTVAGRTDFVGVEWNSNVSTGAIGSANMLFIYNDSLGSAHGQASFDYSGFNIKAGKVTGIHPGTGTSPSNAAVAETWQVPSLPAGWGGGAAYKANADNTVTLAGLITLPSTGSYNNITIFTLQSGYAPLGQKRISMASLALSSAYGNNSASPGLPRVFVDTTGNVSLAGIPVSVNSSQVCIDGCIYPLDF